MDMDNPGDRPEGAVPGTDYRAPAPFKATVSRRRFLQVGGALAGAAAVGGGASQLGGLTGQSRAEAATRDDGRPQARGHPHAGEPVVRPLLRHPARRARLRRQAGTEVPERHDGLRAARHHADRPRVPAPVPHGLDQGGRAERRRTSTTHGTATTARATAGCGTTGSRPRPSRQWATSPAHDLPFNYALADAFTICDGYHQSILGPTSPNRMYFWTGTSGGFIDNPPDYTVEFKNITTYPELLLKAGISWQVYTNHEVGDGGGNDAWVGDFGDNPLWFYQQYQTSMNATTAAGRRARRPGSGAAVAAERGDAARAEPRQPRALFVHRRLRRGHHPAGVLDRRAG